MRKLLLMISLLFVTMLISCGTFGDEYYDQMTQLDEPIEIDISLLDSAWVTYEFVMNDEEILYYAPRKVTFDDNVYLNDDAFYFIVKQNGIFRSITYPTDDDLREIFRE